MSAFYQNPSHRTAVLPVRTGNGQKYSPQLPPLRFSGHTVRYFHHHCVKTGTAPLPRSGSDYQSVILPGATGWRTVHRMLNGGRDSVILNRSGCLPCSAKIPVTPLTGGRHHYRQAGNAVAGGKQLKAHYYSHLSLIHI